MDAPAGVTNPRTRALWWTAAALTTVSALFLVTGLVAPGFLRGDTESSAVRDESGAATSASPQAELPWARRNPPPRRLTPDGAVRRMVTIYIDRLNSGRSADAVDMLCADKRRPIRGAVVWTATHRARLRVTTSLAHAARPGYATVRFAGAIDGQRRRGAIGIDAGPKGQPRCVSTFYSVG